MIQGGCCLRFALETRQRLRITANFLRQKFKGHKAVEPCVLGFVDHAHATATELIGDSIVGDGLTDHWDDILRSDLGGSQRKDLDWSTSYQQTEYPMMDSLSS